MYEYTSEYTLIMYAVVRRSVVGVAVVVVVVVLCTAGGRVETDEAAGGMVRGTGLTSSEAQHSYAAMRHGVVEVTALLSLCTGGMRGNFEQQETCREA